MIMMLAVNIIVLSLQSAYELSIDNQYNIEMINIVESYINDKKEAIKYIEEFESLYEETQIGKYKIESTIEEYNNINRCYRLSVRMIYKDKKLEVDTYVAKK